MTHDDFRFCFKFPQTISHQGQLKHTDNLLNDFLRLLDPLADRIGQYWLQLPAAFSPAQLDELWRFLDRLPCRFSYGVKVRHVAFFAKGKAERALNQELQQRGVNRVIVDSRPAHASTSQSLAALHARQQKPRVPPHALRTGDRPMVRFIGSDDVDESERFFSGLARKAGAMAGGKRPAVLYPYAGYGTGLSAGAGGYGPSCRRLKPISARGQPSRSRSRCSDEGG